jgi:hypothetical protein
MRHSLSSVVRRQILLSAPTGEVCLLPSLSPIFQSVVTSSASRIAFFLTQSSNSGTLKHPRCDTETEGGSANAIARWWCPASFQQDAGANVPGRDGIRWGRQAHQER